MTAFRLFLAWGFPCTDISKILRCVLLTVLFSFRVSSKSVKIVACRQSNRNIAANLIVLIRRHGNELRLHERVSPAPAAAAWRPLVSATESNHVTSRLILPHRVQDNLSTLDELLSYIANLLKNCVQLNSLQTTSVIGRRRCDAAKTVASEVYPNLQWGPKQSPSRGSGGTKSLRSW